MTTTDSCTHAWQTLHAIEHGLQCWVLITCTVCGKLHQVRMRGSDDGAADLKQIGQTIGYDLGELK